MERTNFVPSNFGFAVFVLRNMSVSSISSNKDAFLAALKPTLEAALCLQDFPSQVVERHNKPEVEVRSSPELLLNPVTVSRCPEEAVTVESSINSTRINLLHQTPDPLKRILKRKFLGFLMKRSEHFAILRKTPVPGYDISFLVTNAHLDKFLKHKLIDFVLYFIDELDKEVSEMKLAVNTRARECAKMYFDNF